MILSKEQEVTIAQQLTESGMPPNLIQWLAKLKLLYGIPFQYLVPNNDFLPAETIRFFYLDPDWISSLIDGAMSIGRHYNGQAHPPATIHADIIQHLLLHLKPVEEVHNVRRQQLTLNTTPPPNNAPDVVSGFLINSAVVRGWKNFDVAGYPKGSSPYEYESNDKINVQSLNILRLERLSDSVMIGLFQGSLYELVLHQPPEAIHFGFQQAFNTGSINTNSVTKNLRVPTSDWDDPNTGYDNNTFQNIVFNNVFTDVDERVLDMTALSKSLAGKLSNLSSTNSPPIVVTSSVESDSANTSLIGENTNFAPGYYQANPVNSNFKDHLIASDFALEMVQGVGLVSFINE